MNNTKVKEVRKVIPMSLVVFMCITIIALGAINKQLRWQNQDIKEQLEEK